MSVFTTDIRYICESLAGYDRSQGYMSIDEVIDKSWEKIFPPSFITFSDDYRPVLAKKILKWYYTREIGCETFGLWQLRLDAKLSVIMPYYNKLYNAFNLNYDILTDVNVKTEADRDAKNKSESTTDAKGSGTGSGKTTSKHSNTPQGGLDGIESDRYLSSADISDSSNKSSSTNNVTSSGNASTTEEYVQMITGKRGGQTYTAMIAEYAEKLKNIDRMVIGELEDLFMQIWDWGGDDFRV